MTKTAQDIPQIPQRAESGCAVSAEAGAEEKLLLGLDEAARLLGIPKATLLTWAWQGKVPCVRLGRRRYFRRQDLELWIERHVCPVRTSSLTSDGSGHTIVSRKWMPGRERR